MMLRAPRALVRGWLPSTVLMLVVLAAALRMVDLDVRAMHHDESLHGYFAWLFANGGGYVHNPLMHGPFQFHVVAGFFKVFGDSEAVSRLPAAICGAALVATPLLLRRQLGSIGVVWASALLVISPSLLYYSRFSRNDLFVAAWTVLLIAAVWRYLEDGRLRWLLLVSAVLSLAFCSKETAYLTAALLLIYLSVAAALRLASYSLPDRESAGRRIWWTIGLTPFAWLIAATWPLLGRLRSRLGWAERPREVDLLVLMGTLTGSQLAAAVQLPAALLASPLTSEQELIAGGAAVTALLMGGAVVGCGWNWRWWLPCAALFAAIYATLFTTGFTNLDGIGSGLWGQLDYWIAQQDVRRGEQPWFYYFMMVPIYELLGLVVGVVGGLWLVGRGDRLSLLFLWWFLATFIMLSLAGEKMPWLTVHLALPLIFLSGRVAGLLLPWAWLKIREPQGITVHGVGLALATGVMLVLVVYTVQSAWAVSFNHPDTPIEPLIYTQTSPDVPPLSERIHQLAWNRPEAGQRSIYVETTQSLSWPWAWYLRDLAVEYVPRERLREEGLDSGAILVTRPDTIVPTSLLRSEVEETVPYHHRWWFGEGGYKSATWQLLGQELVDGSLAADWLSFMVSRVPESTIGSFDGEVLFPR